MTETMVGRGRPFGRWRSLFLVAWASSALPPTQAAATCEDATRLSASESCILPEYPHRPGTSAAASFAILLLGHRPDGPRIRRRRQCPRPTVCSYVDPGTDGDVSAESIKAEQRSTPEAAAIDGYADFLGAAIDFDDQTSRRKNGVLKRLSSIPGLLPGRPLFMRLMPIRSSDVISKIMDEMPLPDDGDSGVDWTVGSFSSTNVESLGQQEERPLNASLTRSEGKETNATSLQRTNRTERPTVAATDQETEQETEIPAKKKKNRRRFFRRTRHTNKVLSISKEELECPAIATNIHELQKAVLIDKVPLRDVGFRFPAQGLQSEVVLGHTGEENGTSVTAEDQSFPAQDTIFTRSDPIVNGSLSSLLTHDAQSSSDPEILANYQRGIALMSLHPVLSIVRERVATKSKPGQRQPPASGDVIPHLALVIEGGGMRGAVSAGMAAALSTLDLLDAFDSIHGSSAGAIVGAYVCSRQLSVDIYTDIMPAAGSKFASKRRGAINFGVDWLADLIQRKYLDAEPKADDEPDGICVTDDEMEDVAYDDGSSWWCEDDDASSSVELAMEGTASPRRKQRRSDGSVVVESASYLLSNTASKAKETIAKPLKFGVRRFGRALRPALSAFDVASSMRQYLRKRPGMNTTYVLDGVMDENHGLRPFDFEAFRANDKRQPLYVVASTVNEGGNGALETVSFNSKDGDFFGSVQENDSSTSEERVSWYRRVWGLFKFAPYTIYSAVRRALSSNANGFSPPVKDTIEAEMIPAGTSAMYGFANRRAIRKTRRPEEDRSYEPTGRTNDEGKKGLFPCLEASMLVPGAAGPPIQLIRSKNRKFVEQRSRFPRFRPRKELNRRLEVNSHLCYDAFCYEPIPFRSAVEKANATHVLALRSRPDGCVVESKQHLYERVVAPIYFRKYSMNQVAKLFSSGGSQYRYLEDVLTLNEGLATGIATGQNDTSGSVDGVKVPPTQLYDGAPEGPDNKVDMDSWKRAQLLPITLPFGTPELPALSQDKDEVNRAVRNGYAAAFDVLAPVAGLPFDASTVSGEKVAKLLFPGGEDDVSVLNKPLKIKPSYIGDDEEESKRRSFAAWITGKREAKRKAKGEIDSHPDGILAQEMERRTSAFHETDQYIRDGTDTLEYIETEALLAALPGFRGGRLDHIADSLLSNEEGRGETKAAQEEAADTST
ncbi:hypothetical protein ACHAXT_012561 [Thalassiosira profunda]